MEPPTYQHNCEACTYLGNFDGHDLYHCTQARLPSTRTLIARFGPGPDYLSGVEFVDDDTGLSWRQGPTMAALRVAYLIARDRGLLR